MPLVPAIRRAVPADATAVADFHTLCWREAYAGLVGNNYLYSVAVEGRRLARWQERLSGTRAVWLAEDGECVVGAVSTDGTRVPDRPVPVELTSLYLRSSYCGTGLADRLLSAAVGPDPAFLWVFAGNLRARRFYARHGFVSDGSEKRDPDTDLVEVRMVRRSRQITPDRH